MFIFTPHNNIKTQKLPKLIIFELLSCYFKSVTRISYRYLKNKRDLHEQSGMIFKEM